MKRTLEALRIGGICAFVVMGVAAQAQYARQGVRFGSQISLSGFPGNPSSGAGGSGYVSASGREYAIIGLRNGQAIVEITDIANPVIINHIPGSSTLWHESAVKGDYAYLVSDSQGVGVQIVDLRNVDQGQAPLVATYTGQGIVTVHTIQASPSSPTIFLHGSNIANGGCVALDVSNPTAPVYKGAWNTRYVHDAWYIKYDSGPYAGKEIGFFACSSGGLYVVDVTNKSSMTTLGFQKYSGTNYCHSVQITNDRKYALVNDELDESNGVYNGATTHVLDVQNLSTPNKVKTFTNNINCIDHNSNLLPNNYMVLAAYTEGCRIYDVSDPLNIKETGYFDTYPGGSGMSFNGDWGLWAFFPSGNLILTDINRGLFVLDPSEAMDLGAVPMDITVQRGILVSGGLKDLRKSDDLAITIEAAKFTAAEISSSVTVIGYETNYSPAAFLDLTLEARSSRLPCGPIQLALKNWNTGLFENVATFQPNLSDQTFIKPGISGNAYVKYTGPSGRIELRISALGTDLVADDSFRSILDMVKVTVRRS